MVSTLPALAVRKTSWLTALMLAVGVLPAVAQRPRPCMGIVIKPDPDGVLIDVVSADGPADLAWLRAGDVIQGIIIGKADRPVRTVPDLTNLMSQLSAGDTVTVRFQRGKKTRVTQVTVSSEPHATQRRPN